MGAKKIFNRRHWIPLRHMSTATGATYSPAPSKSTPDPYASTSPSDSIPAWLRIDSACSIGVITILTASLKAGFWRS